MYNTQMKLVSYFPSACGLLVLTVIQTYYTEEKQAGSIRNSRLVAELNIGVSPAGAARDPAVVGLVGCMAQLSLASSASQCDTFLVGIPFVVQTWQQRMHCSSQGMPYFKHLSLHLPLFTSLPHPHILFAHHDTSPYHPPAASLISSCHYYSCIALFSSHHLSRRGGVDILCQPRSCIFVFFHTSTCSLTL
jgi:hypothetical protein